MHPDTVNCNGFDSQIPGKENRCQWIETKMNKAGAILVEDPL